MVLGSLTVQSAVDWWIWVVSIDGRRFAGGGGAEKYLESDEIVGNAMFRNCPDRRRDNFSD